MAKINKAKFITGNSTEGIGLAVGLEFHKTIDYDRRAMRRALTSGGGLVRKEARRLLARQAISLPGQDPGRHTGRLMRSIGVVSRGSKGGWIKIAPKTFRDKSLFYPAMLFYGRKKGDLAPRANFMARALANQAESVRSQVRAALAQCLVPR